MNFDFAIFIDCDFDFLNIHDLTYDTILRRTILISPLSVCSSINAKTLFGQFIKGGMVSISLGELIHEFFLANHPSRQTNPQ